MSAVARPLGLALALALGLWAAPARAASHADELAAARAALVDNWSAVEGILAPLLADAAAPLPERREALMLLGFAQIAAATTDDERSAGRATFARVFDLDPAAQAPATWTLRIRQEFETARVAWQHAAYAALRIAHGAALDAIQIDVATEPATAVGGRALRVQVAVHDPTDGAAHLVRLGMRRAGAVEFQLRERMLTPGTTSVDFALTPDETASDQSYRLQYYIELRARAGALLAQRASADAPAELAVRAGRPPRLWQRWQLWTAIGVTALLGGTVAALAARDAGPQRVEVTP